jgi:hypothetical protein
LEFLNPETITEKPQKDEALCGLIAIFSDATVKKTKRRRMLMPQGSPS